MFNDVRKGTRIFVPLNLICRFRTERADVSDEFAGVVCPTVLATALSESSCCENETESESSREFDRWWVREIIKIKCEAQKCPV